MISNVSGGDRIIRLVIAVAAIMVVTAAVGFCPLYGLFGLSTKKKVAA